MASKWGSRKWRSTAPKRGKTAHCRLRIEHLERRDLLTGTWTPLVSPAPDRIATMLLLSDGTVMGLASEEGHMTRDWYRLTPDSSGSYVNGSWSQLSSMHDTRVYFPDEVLPDGRVWLGGGEYGTGTRTAEVYDPTTDTWTYTTPVPLGDIGDTPSEILPDGRVLLSNRFSGQTSIYDPTLDTWTAGPTKLRNSRSDEESWVLLPDQSILTVEVFSVPHAQKYLPADNAWVDAGTLPVNLEEGLELGAGLLLPDGRAFFLGANGNTALYTPGADPHDPGSWIAGPVIPNNQGTWDAPAAMLPNGKVLCAVGPRNYGGPANFYEYDPVANTFTFVDGSPTVSGPPYEGRMLELPTGKILWSDSDNQLYVYNPDGAPDPSWQPTISEVDDNGDGTFTLYGTQLNGINEGAAYGDDAEMSSNYPIVQLTDAFGDVFYARTSYWSSTGVATGATLESTYFALPAGAGAGDYSLQVIANGIASQPIDFIVNSPRPAPISHHGSTHRTAAPARGLTSGPRAEESPTIADEVGLAIAEGGVATRIETALPNAISNSLTHVAPTRDGSGSEALSTSGRSDNSSATITSHVVTRALDAHLDAPFADGSWGLSPDLIW